MDAAPLRADTAGETALRDAIAQLYAAGGLTMPTKNQSVVPLSRLVVGQGLVLRELSGLTSRKANDYLLQHGGLLSPLADTSVAPLAGYLYANACGGVIFTRQEDPLGRRRFSAAHELGHWVLHFPIVREDHRRRGREDEAELVEALKMGTAKSAVADDDDTLAEGRIAADSPGLPPLEQMEREADLFAAHLLMPETIVRELAVPLRRRMPDSDLIARLAAELLVSRGAMRLRLETLGLLREPNAHLN